MLYLLQWGNVVEFSEFKRKIDSEEAFFICLFEGEEIYLAEEGLSALKEKYVNYPELDYVKIDGADVTVDEMVSLLTAFPFMSKKRIVAVSEFYPNQNFINGALKDIFTNPSNDNIFVILNKKPCDTLKKQQNVTVIACKKQDKATLVKWVIKEFQINGITISAENAGLICEYSLLDMTKIFNEISKLISYVGDKKIVDSSDVDAVVIKDSEFRIYEMTDMVGKRNFDKALKIITEMLAGGEAPQRLLVSLYYYYRKLFHIALSTDSDAELIKAFGMTDYVLKKLKAQVKAFKIKNLKKAIDVLADYDYSFKSGNISIDTAFLLSVFKVMID